MPNLEETSEILSAVRKGNTMKVRDLMTNTSLRMENCGHKANVDIEDENGKTILHLAVEKGDSYMVHEILLHSPDINNRSNKNSFKIAVYGQKESFNGIVKSLLRYGFTVDPEDIRDSKLWRAAIENDYVTIVESLLKYSAEVHYKPDLLGIAEKSRSEEMTKLLLEYGFDVNVAHVDIHDPYLDIVQLLLDCGADINPKDDSGMTPLHIAAQQGDIPMCKLLLKRGADVHIENNCRFTALHLATQNGHTDVVRILLDYGVDVNPKGETDETLLHSAAQ